MPKTESRPLIEDDVETEVVPETAAPAAPGDAAPADSEATPVSHLQAILDDHAEWIAVADCLYLGQIAFRAGAKVSNTHPGLVEWIEAGTVRRAVQPGAEPTEG